VSDELRSLDRLTISNPCNADWASMYGNDQVRFCEHCRLHVTNLSGITRYEAMRLVARSQGRLCVRYLVRPVTGVIPQSVPEKLYRISRRATRIAAGAFTATLSLSSAAAQTASRSQLDALRPIPAVANPGSSRETGVSLSGVVTDPNGAVVAGANVTLINTQSHLMFTYITGDDGAYKFSLLEAGRYNLIAEAPSFAKTEKPQFDLNFGANHSVNLGLQIPELTAQVDIYGPVNEVESVQGGVSFREPEDPLVKSAYKNDVTEVARLALSGADVNVVDKATNMTGLGFATENGNRDMINVLLSAGAGPNVTNTQGETPLMHLRENATVDLVRELLSAGAEVNARDESGSTPLIRVAAFGSFEVVKLLLDAGAKIDAKDDDGNTVLMSAALNEDTRLLRQLIKAGANVDAKNSNGVSAMTIAARSANADALKALIDAGASLGLQSKDLNDALILAMDTGAPSLVRILLGAGADARAKDSDGKTALMFAAQHGNLAAVQTLIDAGADLNATDDDGWTPMMFADEAEVVRLLLNAGVDLTIKNKDGETALGLARKYDQTEVVKLLESRGAPR
jgi:ankyrin repeat protein